MLPISDLQRPLSTERGREAGRQGGREAGRQGSREADLRLGISALLPGLDAVEDGQDVLGKLFAVTLEDRGAGSPLSLPREDLLGPGRREVRIKEEGDKPGVWQQESGEKNRVLRSEENSEIRTPVRLHVRKAGKPPVPLLPVHLDPGPPVGQNLLLDLRDLIDVQLVIEGSDLPRSLFSGLLDSLDVRTG